MNKISFKNISLPHFKLKPKPSRDWFLLLVLAGVILIGTTAPIVWTYFDLVNNYDVQLSVDKITKKSTVNEKRLKSALEIIDSRAKIFYDQEVNSKKVVDPAR